MRKIIYYVHVSVDGYVEGPNGEFDWAELGPELADHAMSLNERVDTFMYGRAVWDMMSSYWPTAQENSDDEHDQAFAQIWLRTPKVVVSRTLEKADWNTEVIDGGDLAGKITELKSRPGNDMLLNGGAGLGAELTRLGLVDEFHVVVHPVVLTGGKALFGAVDGPADLRLVESRTFDSRTVLLRYVPA